MIDGGSTGGGCLFRRRRHLFKEELAKDISKCIKPLHGALFLGRHGESRMGRKLDRIK